MAGKHRAERSSFWGKAPAEDTPVDGTEIPGEYEQLRAQLDADGLKGVPLLHTGPLAYPHIRMTDAERETMLDSAMPSVQNVYDRLGAIPVDKPEL